MLYEKPILCLFTLMSTQAAFSTASVGSDHMVDVFELYDIFKKSGLYICIYVCVWHLKEVYIYIYF